MDLIINSAGSVSGAGYSWDADFLQSAPNYDAERLLASEPDYTAYIPPMQLRRMSKVVRMGIAAAKACMDSAGITSPDAINVGTTFGCVHDSLFFLSKLVTQDEQMLTPTAFIQSTHNTVAGQIALLTGCYGQNLTFTHRGHSFEHSLINAQIYLHSNPAHSVLVGGVDELTDISIEVLKNAGVYRTGNAQAHTLLQDAAHGTIAGEGAGFFMVGSKPLSDKYLVIKDIETFEEHTAKTPLDYVQQFMQRNGLDASAISHVVLGSSGDVRSNDFYASLQEQFTGSTIAAFKHLLGEYGTASSFALSAIFHAARSGAMPQSMVIADKNRDLNNILFINNYAHHYSCWYITVP
jgi:3-oxoacyl-(acyl-carrier-protein) synthase